MPEPNDCDSDSSTSIRINAYKNANNRKNSNICNEIGTTINKPRSPPPLSSIDTNTSHSNSNNGAAVSHIVNNNNDREYNIQKKTLKVLQTYYQSHSPQPYFLTRTPIKSGGKTGNKRKNGVNVSKLH